MGDLPTEIEQNKRRLALKALHALNERNSEYFFTALNIRDEAVRQLKEAGFSRGRHLRARMRDHKDAKRCLDYWVNSGSDLVEKSERMNYGGTGTDVMRTGYRINTELPLFTTNQLQEELSKASFDDDLLR